MAFHARSATHPDLLHALADLFGVEKTPTLGDLLGELDETDEAELWRAAVDALDEAASPADRGEMVQTLTALAAAPNVRVLVATRALAADNRYATGALLPRLGVRSAGSPALVDLDSDAYFDPEGLRDLAAALLVQDGVQIPTPAGAA